ncbi:MAG TPA: orotidine-5'-phosphate decarboxylase [Burkholderiales bacterium]|nr:orotidine-5'-phosphate decarboxylase [Burkholderiales bacterium]
MNAVRVVGPRVIVALDFSDAKGALAFAARVRPEDCRLKVGLELFTRAGPKLVSELVGHGFDVFLDLKYHDIPNTVANACAAAARLGVWMMNVHTLGGLRMLKAARDAVDSASQRPLLIGVTVLTSHTDEELTEIGLSGGLAEHAERLAAMAQVAGLDGIVCASTEAARLRKRFGAGFTLVTPGIRPSGSATDDQRRTMTPVEAARAGADYLVIGRPITRASDPLVALRTVRDELDAHG